MNHPAQPCVLFPTNVRGSPSLSRKTMRERSEFGGQGSTHVDHMQGGSAVSGPGGAIAYMYGTHLPPREPHQTCESCGVLGTVARLTQFEIEGGIREMHRFCAACWPEQRARYMARWNEESRIAHDEWHRRMAAAESGEEIPFPLSYSTNESSATWHMNLDLLKDLDRIPDHGEKPKASELKEYAESLQEMAPNMVPPMPIEIEQFIEHWTSESAAVLEALEADERAQPPEIVFTVALEAAHREADEVIKAFDAFLASPQPWGEMVENLANNGDVLALIEQVTADIEYDRGGMASATERATSAVTSGNDYIARRALQRVELHRQNIVAAEVMMRELEKLSRIPDEMPPQNL